MVKVRNRFAGHIKRGDPRTPVFGAGGCPWPTIPPYRWALTSDDATGIYRPFNGASIIFHVDQVTARHEHMVWRLTNRPPWLYAGVIRKLFIRDRYPQYSYWVTILMTIYGIDEIAFAHRTGPCNVNVHLGDQIGGIIRGRVGSTFRLLQVESDQTEPP